MAIAYPGHIKQAGSEIRARAIAITLAAQGKASEEPSVTCGAIDKLYGFLDLLDRKAGSLVTLNSFLLALAGFFIFKPLGIFEASSPAGVPSGPLHLCTMNGAIFISGGVAVAASFFSIGAAVGLFRIRWGFMEHITPENANYGDELNMLCNEAAFRESRLALIRELTLFALVLTAVAVAIQLFQIFR